MESELGERKEGNRVLSFRSSAKDYRFAYATAAASAKEKRYDDINLTCSRAHCYDNVFKCQAHERSGEARVRVHTTASAR